MPDFEKFLSTSGVECNYYVHFIELMKSLISSLPKNSDIVLSPFLTDPNSIKSVYNIIDDLYLHRSLESTTPRNEAYRFN